jgi:hypothetical protein
MSEGKILQLDTDRMDIIGQKLNLVEARAGKPVKEDILKAIAGLVASKKKPKDIPPVTTTQPTNVTPVEPINVAPTTVVPPSNTPVKITPSVNPVAPISGQDKTATHSGPGAISITVTKTGSK